MDIEPIHPVFGARVTGIRLKSLDGAAFEALRTAFLDHSVLVLPDSRLMTNSRWPSVNDSGN